MKTFDEINGGDHIQVMYFGKPETMMVVAKDHNEGKVKLQFLYTFGSSWYTVEELEQHQKRIKQYRESQDNIFHLYNDTDANGNYYSDADPGL